MAYRKQSSPPWNPFRRRLFFLVWLCALQFSLSVTCWSLQLLWLGPGRSQPWPWLAPTGMALRAFRNVLIAAGGMDLLVAFLVYLIVALVFGRGLEWGRRSDMRAWIWALGLLFGMALLIEWFGVIHSGAWGYRSAAPSVETPVGGMFVFPVLQRTFLPLFCYRFAWRLAR